MCTKMHVLGNTGKCCNSFMLFTPLSFFGCWSVICRWLCTGHRPAPTCFLTWHMPKHPILGVNLSLWYFSLPAALQTREIYFHASFSRLLSVTFTLQLSNFFQQMATNVSQWLSHPPPSVLERKKGEVAGNYFLHLQTTCREINDS